MPLSCRGRRAAAEEAVTVIPAAFIVTGVATTDTPLRALQAPRVPTVAARVVVGAKSEALHNTYQVLALTAPVVCPLAHKEPLKSCHKGGAVLQRFGQNHPSFVERRPVQLDTTGQFQLLRDGARAPKRSQDIFD